MNVLKRFKAKRYVIAGIVALSVTVLAAVVITTMEAYAYEDYWDVKIGGRLAVLTSESSAKQVIKDVKTQLYRGRRRSQGDRVYAGDDRRKDDLQCFRGP